VNPRYATVCSQCGSYELSTPQPKVSLGWKALGCLVQIAGGVLLVYISLAVLLELVRSPVVQSGMVILGLLLMVLWALWALLPEWIRKLIHRVLSRNGRRDER
jgi:Co/Zn/Cd efflux system component